MLWYNVNAAGTSNRTYTFNLGSTGTALNRLDGPDGVARQAKWQHLVAVMKGVERFLYVDGELVAQMPLSGLGSLHMEGNDARIGSWSSSGDYDFAGVIDEVRFYRESFTQADVSVLYGQGFGDLGVIPILSVESMNSAASMQGRLDFYRFGCPSYWTDPCGSQRDGWQADQPYARRLLRLRPCRPNPSFPRNRPVD